MLGTAACLGGSELSGETAGCPLSPCPSRLSRSRSALRLLRALPKALWRHPRFPSATAGSRLCLSQMPFDSLAQAALQLLCRHSGTRLNRGFGSARRRSFCRSPRRNCRWRLTLHPSAMARATQHKPLRFPGASGGLPRDPFFPTFPQATRPQREGSVPEEAAVRCPGDGGCTPRAARSCSASEGQTALGRPVRSRLPPSLGGQLPPARLWPAAGPICSRGRLRLPGTAASDGSGAEASEAALCQGAPDWLTGLRNGYLVRVKASDWPRGTCNASSEDAGVRVPARCRGAAAAPPGMAARCRRSPQHRPAPGALGPSGQHQRSQRKICRLFVPLQLAAIATVF